MSPKLSSFFLSTLKAVNPHIPMIKFRKGGISKVQASIPVIDQIVVTNVNKVETVLAAPSSSFKIAQSESLEWWQLPEKYKRRKIDDSECDFINSGGSDTIFN